jgi:hypothetical protein
MQFAFGSGSMWGIDSGANPTPGNFGILQDVGIDFPYSNKPLFGSFQLPVAIGRGTAKPSWKAKFAQLSGRVLNSLFFGQTKANGSVLVAEDEAGTITAGSVTVANSAQFVDDLGVVYSATGLPLVRVASAPAVGQYSVSPACTRSTCRERDGGEDRLHVHRGGHRREDHAREPAPRLGAHLQGGVHADSSTRCARRWC